MKKILITQRLIENDSYLEIREALDIRYSKLLFEAGFLPIILPYEIDFKTYLNEIDIEGIVFTGGNDLYSCNTNKLSKKRDEFETALLKYAIEKKIPVLGICRGVQLIAEYFGSSFKEVTNQINVRNKLVVNKNSRYNTYLNNLKSVNSFHNFGIDILGKDLIISASDEVGNIKAIEHKKYKIFGQMWHSERENPFVEKEIDLIKAIL